jgi:hypothetical protein
MPAQAVAGSLAYVNWALFAALGLGTFAVAAGGRLLTDATRGYLGFTAALASLCGLLALVIDLNLPSPDGLAIVAAPGADTPRRVALVVFVVAAAAYVPFLARGQRTPAVALLGVAAGGLALVLGGIGWAGGVAAGVPAALHLLVLAAATGGVTAIMILGHWYLVTPRLSERPLVLAARVLTAVVAVQVVLFVVWSAVGVGTGQPFGALRAGPAVFVWLRLLIGLLFPLVLSWMAVRTARTRSMESATGLLYIDTAAIVSGTIVAAGLWVGSGLLV